MSTDRELLELAAKAAGYDTRHPMNAERLKLDPPVMSLVIPGVGTAWNPLSDDGYALRLAVKLRLVVHVWDDEGAVSVAKTLDGGADPHVTDGDSWFSASGASQEENARRAIVQCAAEIGRSMP